MNLKDGVRTHDRFYLKENRKLKPKEYFKFIVNNLKTSLDNKSVIDIGCATGDFLYYLSTCFPKAELYGADVDLDLLERTKREVSLVKRTFQIDISDLKTDIGKYDAVFMSGVHSIYDELNWINSIKSLLKDENSRGYIFGIFNPD
ncbi:MAG: class I SAM-dependent methyltransferase [Candidatus Marinimicrobia bacterium]|jgi:trans-aconitate methyltransferase|nr:class I SAM-dependent methyltransferase [Candidatus Neomarinimicrobiota bacterium]